MDKFDQHNIEIDKTKEPRTKAISRMIGEGGLGSENYYEIKKDPPKDGLDGKPPKVFKDDDE